LERVHSEPDVLWFQVDHVNALIRAAKSGDCLFGVEEVEDPSDKLIEVHLAVLRYNMQSRRFGLTAPGLVKLRELAIELLELFKTNMPDKSGEKNAWKFEKAHSLLHKVRYRMRYRICEKISYVISYVMSGARDPLVWLDRELQHPSTRALPH
jgi:hypothetical protein